MQWLGLYASIVGGMGSISGTGTKILQAIQHGQRKKKMLMNLISRRYLIKPLLLETFR